MNLNDKSIAYKMNPFYERIYRNGY